MIIAKDNEQFLTKEKFQDLTTELEHLKKTRRREIAEQLEYARSLGDLSENAEYQEARDIQGATEGRIKQLEHMLSYANVIDSGKKKSEVSIGSHVHILKSGDKEDREYIIVSSAEANMRDRKISHMSPLGTAMMGKKKGEIFEFETPNGTVKYKVVKIA